MVTFLMIPLQCCSLASWRLLDAAIPVNAWTADRWYSASPPTYVSKQSNREIHQEYGVVIFAFGHGVGACARGDDANGKFGPTLAMMPATFLRLGKANWGLAILTFSHSPKLRATMPHKHKRRSEDDDANQYVTRSYSKCISNKACAGSIYLQTSTQLLCR
jgi:hypothetical protein